MNAVARHSVWSPTFIQVVSAFLLIPISGDSSRSDLPFGLVFSETLGGLVFFLDADLEAILEYKQDGGSKMRTNEGRRTARTVWRPECR